MRYIYFIALLFVNFAFSQSPAGIWYFGNKAGISFNAGNDPVALNDGQLNTYEGCATLCNEFGDLLFYTDGVKVWNKNHVVMPNGDGLLGDLSSTQSAVIVPKPNDSNLFYVFTVDKLANSNGLNYSIIDLTQDSGFGDIISKNNQLATPCLEKITVVKHANGVNFWVITHRYNSSQFVCYEITPTGINAPITSNVGLTITGNTQRTLGYMKSSPNGQFLACAHSGPQSAVQLFNFNNATGQLGLISTSVMDDDSFGAYGIEFSSNSKLLYVSNIKLATTTSQILQYNIESQNENTINLSKTIVGEFVHDALNEGIFAALQLAPNQKIYIARTNFEFLGAINTPNTQGVGCQFVPEAISLGSNLSYYGLPTFITSYLDLNFTASSFCLGNNTLFEIPEIDNIVSITWNFGDVASPNNSAFIANPVHLFTSPGMYTVTLTLQTTVNTINYSKQIKILEAPIANQPADYNKCEENNNQATFLLTNKTNEVLGIQNPNDYVISYHKNLHNAENNLDPLAATYTNISNPQTIFARIQPKNGNDCFDTTSFQLIVDKNPELEDDATAYYCLNNYPEKITLSAGNVIPAGNYTYTWSTGATSDSIEINESGIYTVEIKNSLGCSSTRTITVIDSNIATISYALTGNVGNYNLIVNATGGGNYIYAIDSSDGPYQNSPVFNNVTSGNHTIFVKDINGCGIISAPFSVLGYPQFFTPNNDGINDTWGLDGESVDFKDISIFDRYGKLLKVLSPNASRWDGTYIGRKLPADDYWFRITLNNNSVENGHFTLKR